MPARAVHLPVLTNSEMKTHRRCVREHYFAYELGYRPANQNAEGLRFGTLFHDGLEAWWRTPTDSEAQLGAAIDALQNAGAEDEYELVRAGVLLQGYDARWYAESEHYEVLAVEQEFYAPLINPETGHASKTFGVAGKLDAIVRDRRDGRVYIVEHKTTSEDVGAGSIYWARLQLDSQVSFYYAGAKSLGYEVAGCIYDVIGKPTLKPYRATPMDSRKYTKRGELYANQRAEDESADDYRLRLLEHVAANPDRYYHRGIVVRLEQEERDAAFDVWQTALAIRAAQRANAYPRNPDACMRYGRACDYFGVCTGSASLEDAGRFVLVDNVHQELSGERAA